MKNLLRKMANSGVATNAFLATVALSSGIANAADASTAKDLKGELTQIFGQILSLAGAFTVAGFITGCWCVFKIIVLITNYQEDARNNKLSGIIYYLIAGGLGFGFAFTSDVFRGTIWGTGSSASNNGVENDVFKVAEQKS